MEASGSMETRKLPGEKESLVATSHLEPLELAGFLAEN